MKKHGKNSTGGRAGEKEGLGRVKCLAQINGTIANELKLGNT